MRVVVYSASYCGYCHRAEALLRDKGVPFERVDVTDDWEQRTWLRQVTGRRTVPQIFIGDEAIGGFTDLLALERSGKLDAMLADQAS